MIVYLLKLIFWRIPSSLLIGFGFIWPLFVFYLFLFSWWTGKVGFIVMLVIYGVVSLAVLFGFEAESREEKRKISDEKIRRAFEESQPTYRINNFLKIYPNEANEILQRVAKRVVEKYIKDKLLPIFNLSINEIQPKTIMIENDNRLDIVNNEVEKLAYMSQATTFGSVLKQIENYLNPMYNQQILNSLNQYEINSKNALIPLNALYNELSKYEISYESMYHFHRLLKHFNVKYQEAYDYMSKETKIIGAGVSGEQRVNNELEMYDYIWKYFSNVRFEFDGQSAESDNIIISKKGIFTVEVKNYSPNGNYGIWITKDGQWLKEYPNGHLEQMNNVTSQMNRHIAIKQKLINKEWSKHYGENHTQFLLKPIFVIANDTIRITNDSDLPIMRISQIYHYIMKHPDVFTNEEVDTLCNIIKDNMLPLKKYELNLYADNLEQFSNALDSQFKHLSGLHELFPLFINEAKEELLQQLRINPKYY